MNLKEHLELVLLSPEAVKAYGHGLWIPQPRRDELIKEMLRLTIDSLVSHEYLRSIQGAAFSRYQKEEKEHVPEN